MTLTTEERRLINLFHSGSVKTVISAVLDALPDINEQDVRVLGKLESMSEAEYDGIALESGGCYAGS